MANKFSKHKFIGKKVTKLKLTDILFTYILAKTDKMQSLKLESDDYCLCIEIPFKIKFNKLK